MVGKKTRGNQINRNPKRLALRRRFRWIQAVLGTGLLLLVAAGNLWAGPTGKATSSDYIHKDDIEKGDEVYGAGNIVLEDLFYPADGKDDPERVTALSEFLEEKEENVIPAGISMSSVWRQLHPANSVVLGSPEQLDIVPKSHYTFRRYVSLAPSFITLAQGPGFKFNNEEAVRGFDLSDIPKSGLANLKLTTLAGLRLQAAWLGITGRYSWYFFPVRNPNTKTFTNTSEGDVVISKTDKALHDLTLGYRFELGFSSSLNLGGGLSYLKSEYNSTFKGKTNSVTDTVSGYNAYIGLEWGWEWLSWQLEYQFIYLPDSGYISGLQAAVGYHL